MSGKKYDVFLSHHSADKPVIKSLARKLEAERVQTFLDVWDLIPGDPWQEGLEKALDNSTTCAVFLGSHGFGPWATEEMRVALDLRAQGRLRRVFAVFLPGTSIQPKDLPTFLKQYVWVDFRSGIEDSDSFRFLLCGIRGERADRPSLSAEKTSVSLLDTPPYRGLEVFRAEDVDLFFGRTSLTHRLIASLRRHRFLAVLGPSGSGKSSVVQAGLVPALHRGKISGSENWIIVLFKPGSTPLKRLAFDLARHLPNSDVSDFERLSTAMTSDDSALAAELQSMPATKILFIVDQFEELLTHTSSETERQAFYRNLLNASGLPSGKASVVLTLRSDFYARIIRDYPDLAERIAARQMLVTPMQESDLWEAINKPAARYGLRFEDGLDDAILQEMRSEPGALPLLQQALLDIWKQRQGDTLTFAAYRDVGGVKGAIAGWAESTYKKLTAEQQFIAHKILVELVQPGDGTEDTRRRVPRENLRFGQPSMVEEILELLIKSRLLTTDRDPLSDEMLVEIAHESLLQEWPSLRGWLEQSKSSRLLHSRLQGRVRTWIGYERHPDVLPRGPELAEFELWSLQHPEEVSPLEEEYLVASIEARGAATDTGSLPLAYVDAPSQKLRPEHRGGPILEIQQPWDLSATGWAVVFAPNLDRRVRHAIEELLEYRRAQATIDGRTHYYRELTYQGESTADFLRRNGARPGMIADPEFLPYYLLLVGDPEALPYRFQSELDVNYAVGRIYFDRIEDYVAYARSAVSAETRNKPRPRKVAFFGTAHMNDPASHMTSQELVHKLAESVRELRPAWEVQEVLGPEATKKQLHSLLGGPETPALLFTACHGLSFAGDDQRQENSQGALICQDWPGPDDEEGVDEDQWFAASDVPEAASLQGLVAFFYSCYSLGTPQHDNFDQTSLGNPRPIAPKAFVSQLPQRLLAHRKGGMLAIIGHVDRSWTSSFEGSPQGEGINAFRYMLRRLLQGHTVGWAMEHLNQSYASLAAMLGNVEEEWRHREGIDKELFAQLWRLRNDARNFMVFGDPAVRLPGVGEPR